MSDAIESTETVELDEALLGNKAENEDSGNGVLEEIGNESESDDNDASFCAGKLYDTILRHPDWRVVEVSEQGADYCHPLKYVYSDGELRFQYDGTARQFHYNAGCEEIIDLNGAEPFDEDRYGEGVYIFQDIFAEEWDVNSVDMVKVRKSTLDASAKWIKLHPGK